MTAIKNADADRFLADPPKAIFAFLIHGNDPGLIAERVQALTKASVDDVADPFQLIRLDGDDVAADPLRLVDEANTIPMFGGRRAILVDAGSKNFAPALEMLFAAPPVDCAIIIGAGALKKDAPLRKLLEKEKAAAAIECYPDDAAAVQKLIDAELHAAGLTISQDARQMLADLLGADRLTTRAELSKLVTYAHGQKQIDAQDVEAIVTDASALSVDTAIDGAFSGQYGSIDETAARVWMEGGDPGVLIGTALRHAISLHRARLDIDGGKPLEGALMSAMPRLFWKRKATVQRQLNGWSETKLARAIAILAEAVGRARREPRLGEVIAVRALWAVALAAKSR
ncbi:DNA polymerase III subunit delta [Methylovirgula sp. 4M-Z18]|uniref:DNA polymerase III subunit delta n=1 Tax=Methylovirgula sp. 4M-Z18 TaxID=2293567 RepID=UPI000E2FD000|nr:DNA polymerase III subunit delta [Methylovirgula sp. 4M-Z18]RFB78035.1 DNA polymerase III subunit delta [Methylovirgula sp. 4M-Z18]